MDEFIKNWKSAGGEIVESIPEGWYVVDGKFGVIESGAVWVEEYDKNLFLSENLLIKLPKKFVNTTEDAMDLIENEGILISGPSKTADVESFLVYGAHGPFRCALYFV
ncbi:LUD domain-containing protein [Caminibacter sp.]